MRLNVLADARSNPYSRFASQFDKDYVQNAIQANGIKYLFLGRELGGRPKDPESYDPEGHVLYSKIADSPLFYDGIGRLMTVIKTYRVAIMCSEENPTHCHRQILVGRVLSVKGSNMRKDAKIRLEDDLIHPYSPVSKNDMALTAMV